MSLPGGSSRSHIADGTLSRRALVPVVPARGPPPLNAKGGAALDDKYLFVVLVLAILFGASRLPSLGRNFGEGIREFRPFLASGMAAAALL